MSIWRYLFIIAFTAILLTGSGQLAPARAQEPDDSLEKLLEGLDNPQETATEDMKDGQQGDTGPVAPQDEGLDSLLKKLGETRERPDTTGPARAAMPEGGQVSPRPDQPGKQVGQGDQALDEHLEELLGRTRKKPPEEQQKSGQESGPLSEAIRKMDQVRQKLEQNDTGDQTRQTQGEIVKQLDTILEQLRQARSQSRQQSRQTSRETQQAGNQGKQQGNQPGTEPGNTGQGVGSQAPLKPKVSDLLAGQKDTWGDLPPHLRAEMENVFREEMLPSKEELIRRYYSSVSRKGRADSEGSR